MDPDNTAEEVAGGDPAIVAEIFRIEVASLLADLDHALTRLDALGFPVAANHVSMSLELLREHARSLENGDNS